jgi:hypothetical protein
MSWFHCLDYKGLQIAVLSDVIGGEFQGEVVGVFIRDADTIQAIRARDERILDMLNYMVDEIEELSLVRWHEEKRILETLRNEICLDEYEALLSKLLQSKYADQSTINNVKTGLDWVAEEKTRKAKQVAKQIHVQRRRSQFSQKYDQLMLALIHRDGFECAICGTTNDLTIDHITPLSKGGDDELANLRLLCRLHNSLKGDS